MRLTSAIAALCAALAAHAFPAATDGSAIAAPTPLAASSHAYVDRSDWKYKVGWDGVTLPSDAIGSALTANGTDAHLQKRNIGGVFLCTDYNWQGHCGYAVQPLNTCIVLGSEWAGKVSSFGPDGCTQCVGFGRKDCTLVNQPDINKNKAWQFDYPGDALGGLQTYPDNPWNDQIGSFRCSQVACGSQHV